jgi:hypothetical protein
MRGTGAVRIGTELVYAYFHERGQTVRLRLSADECDRLDLFLGTQVQIALPDQDSAVALVTAVVPAPPFAWVEVEFAARVGRAG